jgi:7-keto-8-aminopelargonate synthetase-like enzyme
MLMLASLMECAQWKRYTYANNDLESMKKKICNVLQKMETGGGFVYYRRCFGMRGQQGKLKEIVALKKKVHLFAVDTWFWNLRKNRSWSR